MKNKLILLMIAMILVAPTITYAATIIKTINAFDATANCTDTFLQSNLADTVNGANEQDRIGDDGGIRRTLRNFSFLADHDIPTDATINWAKLEVYVNSIIPAINLFHGFPMSLDWGEGVTTWNSWNTGGVNMTDYNGTKNLLTEFFGETTECDNANNYCNISIDTIFIEDTIREELEFWDKGMLIICPACEASNLDWSGWASCDSSTDAFIPSMHINYTEAPDSVKPSVNITNINASDTIIFGNNLNISCFAQDNVGLSKGNITFNLSGINGLYNFSFDLSGTTATYTQNITMNLTRGALINASCGASDAIGNFHTNSTLITIGNTLPNGTNFINVSGDSDRTNRTWNFTACFDPDGDTLNYTILWGEANPPINFYHNGTGLNISTNVSNDGITYWQVKCADDIGESSLSPVLNFTLDTTFPTLLLFNLTNNTRFGYQNVTFNITVQDLNPFRLQFNFHNASIDTIYNQSNDVLNSSTTLSLSFNLNLTGLASGNYTLDINFSDKHTDKKIEDYFFTDMPEGLLFVTPEGHSISIIQIDGKKDKKPKTEKKFDRYTIEYGTTKDREVKRFLVNANSDIYIIEDSEYKGHLIIGNRNWMDFENGDPESEVSVERVGFDTVIVQVYSNNFNFNSIGGLNVVNVFYTFEVDNDPPDNLITINNTIPEVTNIVNISGNATDIIAVSTIFISHNDTGTWVNATDKTVSDDTTNFVGHFYMLTVTAAVGETIGAMACSNDTFNNFSCSSPFTVRVNDPTAPTITGANNGTRFLGNVSINFTFDVTDNLALHTGQVIVDENNAVRIFNTTLDGTSDAFHQNITLAASAGECINVTGRVNDTFNNLNQFENQICLTKDLFINATNIYDNTTILNFQVTLSNSTFSSTNSTVVGLVNFTNIIKGSYDLDISSNDSGGYHNISFTGVDVRADFTARMYQAIVYFKALIRGTDINLTAYNLEVDLARNSSNSTGGLRLLINASPHQVRGDASGFFNTLTNITLGNQSTTRLTALFPNINVSIEIFSVPNATFLKDFTIALEGTDFSESLTDDNSGNVTFSLGNNTYNIIVSHPNFASAPFSFVIQSNDTFPNLTFSLLGLNSINFSIFDELTELPIPQNATINMVSDDFVVNFTVGDGTLYVQDLIIGDYRITYSSDKFTERDHYLSVLNDSNQSVDLYLLSTGNDTDVTFTVQDNSGNEITNATIRLKRYYLSTNSYRTVAMSRTNEEGDSIINVDFNDEFYETLTTFKEFSLRTIGARIISTTRILTLNLIADPLTTVDTITNVNTDLTFNNLTETFSYVFTDLAGQNRKGTLTVIEITPTTETVLCTSTDTSSSATLICQVNTSNITGTFTAVGAIEINGIDVPTNIFERTIGTIKQGLNELIGSQGIFFTILIAGTLAGLGAVVSPAVGILMFLVGLGIINFLAFTILKLSLYVTFLIIGGIIMYKMKAR